MFLFRAKTKVRICCKNKYLLRNRFLDKNAFQSALAPQKLFRKSFVCAALTFHIKIGEGITKGYYFYSKNVLG